MPRTNVGRRYAQGVFQLAEAERDIDGWRGQLEQLDALLQDDVLRAAFANPGVPTPRRLELAQKLGSELRPETRNLLRLLIEHRRTAEMPDIRREFDGMADQAQGIVDATLITAVPLNDADLRRYEQELAKALGRKVRLEHQRDPGLIGGATIQVGDRLIDGSVRTQLERLRQRLAA